MGWYSKHDGSLHKFVPSVAKACYNPFVKVAGNVIAGILARPFPELRELPPNHLRIRTGVGNQILNMCQRTKGLVKLGQHLHNHSPALLHQSWMYNIFEKEKSTNTGRLSGQK